MRYFFVQLEIYRRSTRAFWLMCLAFAFDAVALFFFFDALDTRAGRITIAAAPAVAFLTAFLLPKSFFFTKAGSALGGMAAACGSFGVLFLALSPIPWGLPAVAVFAACAAIGSAWGLLCRHGGHGEGSFAWLPPVKSLAAASLRAPKDTGIESALGAAKSCWPQWLPSAMPSQDGASSSAHSWLISFPAEAGFSIELEKIQDEKGPRDSSSEDQEEEFAAVFLDCSPAPEAKSEHALAALRDSWTRQLRSMGIKANELG